MSEEKEINYLKLAFAVCGGILLAAIISNAIYVYWFKVSTDQQIEVFNKQITEITQESRKRLERAKRETAQRQAEQQKATEQQRAKSKTGQTLLRECGEYSDFYQNQPGSYAREQRAIACKKYRVYIETGRTTS
jgi:hypothetical protein